MAKFCPKCGFENEDEAGMCASCGTSLTIRADSASGNDAERQTYLQGVMDLRNYTIIGFISLIVGIAINLATLKTFSYDYLIGPLGLAFGGASLNTSNVSALLAYSEIGLAVSAVLTVIGLYMLFRGFGALRTVGSEFSIGRTGAILEIFGMVILLLGTIGILAILIPVVNLGNSSSAATLAQSELVAILGIAILVAAVILLVGVIMVMIGVYRVGSRFHSGLVQAGAILTFFLGIIGTILLFVGFTNIIDKLRNSGNEMGFQS